MNQGCAPYSTLNSESEKTKFRVMSITDYRQAGFLVSIHIEQAIIDRAERDIWQAYIEPIAPSEDITAKGVARDCFMQLVNLLVLQRTIQTTRSGAKEKTSPQSVTSDRWQILSQEQATAAMKIERLAKLQGVKDWAGCVYDICGILFTTQYIGG